MDARRSAVQTLFLFAATCVICALAGCASTPQGSAARDAEAKRFAGQPDSATLYVYRPDLRVANEDDPVLWLDDQLIGATLPRAFFRMTAAPGPRRLAGSGLHHGNLALQATTGSVSFIRLRILAGHAVFEPVDPALARQELLVCCDLLENWAPGQRPLLK